MSNDENQCTFTSKENTMTSLFVSGFACFLEKHLGTTLTWVILLILMIALGFAIVRAWLKLPLRW